MAVFLTVLALCLQATWRHKWRIVTKINKQQQTDILSFIWCPLTVVGLLENVSRQKDSPHDVTICRAVVSAVNVGRQCRPSMSASRCISAFNDNISECRKQCKIYRYSCNGRLIADICDLSNGTNTNTGLSAVPNEPARRAASRQTCCKQRWTLSVINWRPN